MANPLTFNKKLLDQITSITSIFFGKRNREARNLNELCEKGCSVIRVRGINHFAGHTFRLKRSEEHSLAKDLQGRGDGDPYSEVFWELKQIPRTWLIRLLVRASKTCLLLLVLLLRLLPSFCPLPSATSAIRSILGFTYRRRNCECRRPCNCKSSKENGNLPRSR